MKLKVIAGIVLILFLASMLILVYFTLVRVRPPTAKFDYSPIGPSPNEMVAFNASGSMPGRKGIYDAPIVSYEWDFGDGTTGTGVTAYHNFTTEGFYRVNLTVTDTQGLWSTTSEIITVLHARIYIRADGSVEGTVEIQREGNLYTFTDNISTRDGVVVDRDGIVVDGAGYTLQGIRSGTGIKFLRRDHVTIKNLEIKKFEYAINLWGSSNNIYGNNITNNSVGIRLVESSNNNITENNVVNNGDGIWLYDHCSYNSISENNVANNLVGIWLGETSDDNSISRNNIEANEWEGLRLHSSKNTVYDNYVENNGAGITFSWSSNNKFRSNKMANNKHNLDIWGGTLSDFVNDIDTSNTVDGKAIYYWVNKQDVTVPLDAGYVALVNCKRITVQGLNLNNNGEGVLLAFTINSTVTENVLINNGDGILLWGSSNNIIYGNNIKNNYRGIGLWNSSNNLIYHNYFVNNTQQVKDFFWEDPHEHPDVPNVPPSVNVWDDGYPSGGNYWSNYTDVDQYSGPYQNETGSDGIWDHPYVIYENNRDNYPLTTKVS